MPRIPIPERRAIVAGGVLLAAGAIALLARGGTAADHRDSMLLTENPAQDIADVYSFQSPSDPSRFVLAMTVSGLIPPAEAGTTYFDPEVLYQFKIDTDADAAEDLVLQAYVTGDGADQVMHFRGPVAPALVGATSRVVEGDDAAEVRISTGESPEVATGGGLRVFAGVRDDPFFFDLTRFREIVAGQATEFNDPGTDAFAGTNVLAIVVELPTALLGSNPQIGVWGTTSRFTNQ